MGCDPDGQKLFLADVMAIDSKQRGLVSFLEATVTSPTVLSEHTHNKWRQALAVVSGLIPAFVFALAGIAKLRDSTPAPLFMQGGLLMNYSSAHLFIPIIAWTELAVAAWLAYGLGTSRKPGVVALLLVGFFAGLLLSAARLHPRSQLSCGCFGELQFPVGGRSIISHFFLNCALAGMLLIHVWASSSCRRPITLRTA